MASDVQPPDDPPAALLDTARRVTRPWLDRLARRALGPLPAPPDLDAHIDQLAGRLIDRLEQLVATDVDHQTTNPLSLYRAATEPLTAAIKATGAPPVARDRFSEERFPDDIYGFMPGGWDDIDPDMQPVGLAWGAWKAMTVLRRRRDEGLR